MKIIIVIPTKDGGDDFEELIQSIKENINYLKAKGYRIQQEIIFAINGNPEVPLRLIRAIHNSSLDIEYKIIKKPGKVRAINEAIKGLKGDLLITLDDDVSFPKHLLYKTLNTFEEKKNIQLVSFQTKLLPYKGKNLFRRFKYDIINIRSLRSLFKNVDPFLFGRFIALRGVSYPVPNKYILDDTYLNAFYYKKMIIHPDYVYSYGVDSILTHIKRVLRLEAGRKQMEVLHPIEWRELQTKSKRIIDQEKLSKEHLYYQLCFHLYNALRFVTNGILMKILKHKTVEW